MGNESITLTFEQNGDQLIASPSSAWLLSNLSPDFEKFKTNLKKESKAVSFLIDGSKLQSLDTAGAAQLLDCLERVNPEFQKIEYREMRAEHQRIFELVVSKFSKSTKKGKPRKLSWLQLLGETTISFFTHFLGLLSILGRAVHGLLQIVYSPKSIRFKETVAQLEQVCVNALPICGLVTFLIGVVVAYLSAVQMQKYGANIFIVDAIGMAMCRELSPILIAIIVAGRSGSAFTAQIGAMKLNEEVDAIRVLGLDPMHVLVLPRIFALMLAMPILVFLGDCMGILGGYVIAESELGISAVTFLERLRQVLPLKAVWVGLIKAPVFALVIALIGCRMGLSVENNARSLGLHTTSTVVQSIVSVILLNAAFAVFFVELGI